MRKRRRSRRQRKKIVTRRSWRDSTEGIRTGRGTRRKRRIQTRKRRARRRKP